jgi:hypothetical protein
MQNFVFAGSVRTGGRAELKILMFVQVVIAQPGEKSGVRKTRIRSSKMGNWGSVSREDFDNYNRDRRRVMDDHSKKARYDYGEHNRRINGWISEFAQKYVIKYGIK